MNEVKGNFTITADGKWRIELEDGITEIADEMFKNFTSLESVVLPKSVKKIGKSAFEGCKELKNVEGIENVTEMESVPLMDVVHWRLLIWGMWRMLRCLKV